MGSCIEKIKHSCGSNNLQVFEAEDGYNGFCYGCGTYVSDPYKDKPVGYKPVAVVKSPEEVAELLNDINQCGSGELKERKLKKAVCSYYNIKIGLSEKDGVTPTVVYFPYTKKGSVVKYKAKLIAQKKMWSIGDGKGVDLFGWEQAVKSGNRRLYITEGEEDAMALFSIIKRYTKAEYADVEPAVVSLPDGAGCAKAVLAKFKTTIDRHFQDVVLVFDQDRAGELAVDAVMSIAPKWISASLPCKDANACLVEGHSKAAFNAVLFRAEKPKNTRLVWGEDIHEEAKERAEFGVSYPWFSATDLTRGIRTGETIYIGAAQKMG